MDDKTLNQISDEQLDKVAGGYIFDASVLECSDPARPWEVLDNDGDVLERCQTREEAAAKAKEFGYTTWEISWEEVQTLRATGFIW